MLDFGSNQLEKKNEEEAIFRRTDHSRSKKEKPWATSERHAGSTT
jgi:hypothetical protein